MFNNQLLDLVLTDLRSNLPPTFPVGFEKNLVDPYVHNFPLMIGPEEFYHYPVISATWRGDMGMIVAPIKMACVTPASHEAYRNRNANMNPYSAAVHFVTEPNGCTTSLYLPFVQQLSKHLVASGWQLMTWGIPYFGARYEKTYQVYG